MGIHAEFVPVKLVGESLSFFSIDLKPKLGESRPDVDDRGFREESPKNGGEREVGCRKIVVNLSVCSHVLSKTQYKVPDVNLLFGRVACLPTVGDAGGKNEKAGG